MTDRPPHLESKSRSKRWGSYDFILSPLKRFLLDRPLIRGRPFLQGATSGALYGIGLLLDLILIIFLAGLFDLLFGQHGAGGMVFLIGFLALPWSTLIGQNVNVFVVVAFGIVINIALLSVAWGVVTVARTKLQKVAP